MRKTPHHPGQLTLDGLLSDAERLNHDRETERQRAHLPATMDNALPFFRELLEAHHAAMLEGLTDEAMSCRREACELAVKLNAGAPGILAVATNPGRVLARLTAAGRGAVPLWGQEGSFVVEAGGARVRVEMEGVFGIAASTGFWPGFGAHAVELDRPFISETGFRSFLGLYAPPVPGLTPDAFAAEVIAAHVVKAMKGRLVAIEARACRRARP